MFVFIFLSVYLLPIIKLPISQALYGMSLGYVSSTLLSPIMKFFSFIGALGAHIILSCSLQ